MPRKSKYNVPNHVSGFAHIYALRDPNSKVVRYIGQCHSPWVRMVGHCNPAHRDDSPKARWIRLLKIQDEVPIFEVLELASWPKSTERERFWIAHFANAGHPLFNLRDNPNKGEK